MLGPFEIAPEDVARLGNGFTDAVNQLLRTEATAIEMAGSSLVLNRMETIPDGGVDAEITDAPAGGEWIPEGDSVWQFKRSNLYPKECAEEFGRAGWAQQKVRAGSAYVMVLGVSLSPELLERRRVAILKKGEELGLNIGGDWLSVRDANALARWISLYPSLAVSRVMGGPGSSATDFATWADSRLGRMEWVPDEARQDAIRAIRSTLSRPANVDLRVEGTPGVGKSRLVLEALRDGGLAPLVAYIADEAEMTGEMFHHLVGSGRCVVLVVDRCPADRHGSLAERLPNDSTIKLVTIGPVGYAVARRRYMVKPMPSEAIDKVVSQSFSGLSTEDRRLVVDNSAGYPQAAEILAWRVLDSKTQLQAADLVTKTEVRQFIVDRSPGSVPLRVAEGIALFEKLGWEEDLSEDREQLARFLKIPASEMQGAGRELEEAGWVIVRGRYRAIVAHPLAVFLASRKWERDGDRIVDELLDRLEEPMALAMFRRLADLGRLEPAQNAVAPLLAPDGPFGSFEDLRSPVRAARLTHLAIVLPNEVALHIHELLERTSDEKLRSQPTACRELAWALEKLAWHTDTFHLAAGSLLRLALVEYTTGGDSDLDFISASLRSGATSKWTSLFGTMLPATAADPKTRTAYLREVARSDKARERAFAVEGFEEVIAVSESVMVSAELQGGAAIEARGTPETWDEAWDYQIAAITELGRLVGDPDRQVRIAAEDRLIGAIGPLAGSGRPWEALENVLTRTPGLHGRVRYTLQSYESLYNRADLIDDSDERAPRRQFRMEALASLKRRLPDQDSRDTLQLALSLPRWDHPADRIERAVVDAMASFLGDHDKAGLFEFLSRNQPNAREFGAGLASLPIQQDAALPRLVDAYDTNPEALDGYLESNTETEPHAVETFLDSSLGRSMPDVARHEIARVGQQTERIREIIDELIDRLPVAESAVRVRVAAEAFPEMLQRWIRRLETQQDYNMVVNRVSCESRSNNSLLGEIGIVVLELVLRRREFPKTGNASWNWRHLAKAVLPGNEEALAELVLDMIENPERVVTPGSTEVRELLGLALQQSTERVWRRIGERLENGSSRLANYAETWHLLAEVEPNLIQTWVGKDANRARIAARVAPLGGDDLTPMARHVLTTFGDDEQVTSIFDLKLERELQVGKRSAHIQSQVDRLNSWRSDQAESYEVRNWARSAIAKLEMSKKRALRDEEERGW